MTELIGRIFDRKYRLVRLIGEGGMGAVFEAEHTVIERKVAVKVMHQEFSSSEEVVNRFFREAEASSAIGHPNIIEIFDVGQEEDGTAFIVMELLKGQSLATKLKEDGRMPSSHATAVILQVLSALAVSHEKGIIHRDLKPDNVFLAIDNRGRNEVKLLDFGIAKIQFEKEGDQGLTKTGTVLGTPNYMSPEAARGKDIDGRIDIWAAGVMLYEMLSGRLPFRGASYNAVLSDILLETPKPIAEMVPGLPAELVKVVEKAMEKDRDKRYPTVSAMISDLLPFNEATAMTDSAALALKNSLVPPPSMNDTILSTPALTPLSRTISDDALERGSITTRELEFGAALPQNTKNRRGTNRRGTRVVFALLLIAVTAMAGLAFFFKAPKQTVGESGMDLLDQAVFFWKHSPLWPYKNGKHIPPEIGEPGITPEPFVFMHDAGVLEDGGVKESLEKITLKIKGAPKGARITLNGNPIESTAEIPKSDKPGQLKVVGPQNKVFVADVILDKDRTILVKLKSERKSGSKSKKTRSKKSSRSH